MQKVGDLSGKTAFFVGVQGHLETAIAKHFASQGASVTLFGPRAGTLEEARQEISVACASTQQEVKAVIVDLEDATQLENALNSQDVVADFFYCIDKGNDRSSDVTAAAINKRGVERGNFDATFAAKLMLNIWIQKDECKFGTTESFRQSSAEKTFMNSGAAYAWSSDSMNSAELIWDCAPRSRHSVRYAFPQTVLHRNRADSVLSENSDGQELKVRAQVSDNPLHELEYPFPTSDQIASLAEAASAQGDFLICRDSSVTSTLFPGIRCSSLERRLSLVEGLVSSLVGWVMWPLRSLEYRLCVELVKWHKIPN